MTTNRTGYNNVIGLLNTFPDEAACARHLEYIRWPDGIVCQVCGSSRKIHRRKKAGVYRCADCKKEFSVRKGTIYEESPLPLQKWFLATFLMVTSRKGISSYQLAREIGVTQKTAWFVLGRLRKAAEQASRDAGTLPGPVEADETYMGGKNKNRHANQKQTGRGPSGKMAVAGAVSRTSGNAVAKKVEKTDTPTLARFLTTYVEPKETLYTDEARAYTPLGSVYQHESVNHSAGEYVKGKAHTNGVESFWALLKRGYTGVFHDFTWKHLDRYLAEFPQRWNMLGLSSEQRIDAILKAGVGERLTYASLTAD